MRSILGDAPVRVEIHSSEGTVEILSKRIARCSPRDVGALPVSTYRATGSAKPPVRPLDVPQSAIVDAVFRSHHRWRLLSFSQGVPGYGYTSRADQGKEMVFPLVCEAVRRVAGQRPVNIGRRFSDHAFTPSA